MIAQHVARWTRHHGEQRKICTLIGKMAARLPLRDIDAPQELASALAAMHEYEDGELFPILEALSPQMAPLLDTFRRHHDHDGREALAIAQSLAASDQSVDTDALGARMRALAENLMRHVEFEEAICRALFASKRMDEERRVQ